MSAGRFALIAALCVGLIACRASAPARATAETPDEPGPGIGELVEEQARRLDDGEFQRLLDQMYRDTEGYAPMISWREVASGILGGGAGLDLQGIARGLGRYMFREIVASMRLLGKLVILAVAVALLQNLGASLDSGGVANLAESACYLSLVVMAAGSFSYSVGVARGIISNMVTLMKALLPTLVALVAASGAPVSASLLHPIMISTVYAVSVITSEYVLTLLMLAAVLEIAGHVVRPFRVSGLAALLKQASTLVLGLSMAFFVGVVVVNRAAGGVADGVALRSAKFLSGTFVPVVGKMFSDAVDMVFASSHLLRTAVGLTGAAAVIVTTAFPLCKIASLVVVYRIAAALVQPMGAGTLSECLNGIAGSLALVSVAAAAVAMMFVIGITALVVAVHP
ncbi:MAG: stage III sporulation protein AE [Ignavibacteriales bacterium]